MQISKKKIKVPAETKQISKKKISGKKGKNQWQAQKKQISKKESAKEKKRPASDLDEPKTIKKFREERSSQPTKENPIASKRREENHFERKKFSYVG